MEIKQIKELMAAMGRTGMKRLSVKDEGFELQLERQENGRMVENIGDSLDEDVAGARAAGIEAVLLHRGKDAVDAPADLRVIASLREW